MEPPEKNAPRRAVPPGPRACLTCRTGKIRCDMAKPSCSSCLTHGKHCIYTNAPPKARPSRAIINSLLDEKHALTDFVWRLKSAAPQEREDLLSSTCCPDGSLRLSRSGTDEGTPVSVVSHARKRSREPQSEDGEWSSPRDNNTQASDFLSVDEAGKISALGPTSSLHNPMDSKHSQEEQVSLSHARNQLFANAAYQRQMEHSLYSLSDIDGVPIDLATHLLDVYWNRPHHAFLVVYRPAFTRDLISRGPYATTFLVNVVFAAASKYSNRPEVRDDPADPKTSGARFFRRCEALLTANSSMPTSDLPTASGLCLLASAELARGSVSKSWLYSGLAVRMIYDLGLHIDSQNPRLSAEEIEIRRRVFWAAFVYDKIQSLYLGRPFMIHLEDSNVPCDYLDMMEERDLYQPYVDPSDSRITQIQRNTMATPYHSISNFLSLARLCRVMAMIIQQLYLAGAQTTRSAVQLDRVDRQLTDWYANLPEFCQFQPWDNHPSPSKIAPPNIMVLNTTYWSLVILLHRPFLSAIQLSEDERARSWSSCSKAASNITSILRSYRSNYTLRSAPYLASYACYVACTIHIHNAGLGELDSGAAHGYVIEIEASRQALSESLEMLDELAVSSPCITWPTNKIRRILRENPIPEHHQSNVSEQTAAQNIHHFPDPPYSLNSGVFHTQFDTSPGNDVVTINDMMNGELFGFMDGFDPRATWMDYSAVAGQPLDQGQHPP